MRVILNRVVLLAAFSVAGYMAWDYQARLFENKGRLAVYKSSLVPGAVEFSWKSAVEIPMAKRFYEAFEKWNGKSTTIVINLHSPGGSLREGRELIEVINLMKKSHKIVTFVGGRHSCLSMCVPIFLQGDERVAAPSSKWMFHEPRSVDFFTDKTIKEPEFEHRRMVQKFVNRYFVNSSVSPTWRKKLIRDWKGKDVWFTGQELFNQKSGIITRLL